MEQEASKKAFLHVNLKQDKTTKEVTSDLEITLEDGTAEQLSEIVAKLARKRRADQVILTDDGGTVRAHFDPTTLVKVNDSKDLNDAYRFTRSALGMITSSLPDGYITVWK